LPRRRADLARVRLASLGAMRQAEFDRFWRDQAVARDDELDRGGAGG